VTTTITIFSGTKKETADILRKLTNDEADIKQPKVIY